MPRRPTLREEIYAGIHLAYRELVPLRKNRIILEWRTLPHAFFYLVPFLFLAYLVRRANTHLIRLLLFPTILTSTVYCTYHFRVSDPRYVTLDWIRTLMGYYIIAKTLNFTFVKHGRLKVGEKKLREINEPVSPVAAGETRCGSKEKRRAYFSLPECLHDALEVSLAVRGIGWDFGHDVHTPRSARPARRGPFLRATALSLLRNFFIVDLCDSLVKLVPGVGSVEGGSMFLPDLPFLLRYLVSTAIHILGGTMVMCGVEAGNEFVSMIAVGLLGQSPTAWPPLYDNPWMACSLHDFWGKGWHQVLRHTFLTFGGYPGEWLAGNVGMVLGTFLASGMYHEIGLRISDRRVTYFFLLQGIGILLENGWKKLTGRRVGGLAGWVWTAFWVLVVGQMCMDAWSIGGIAGAVLVPRKLSFARRVLLPTMRHIVRPLSQ